MANKCKLKGRVLKWNTLQAHIQEQGTVGKQHLEIRLADKSRKFPKAHQMLYIYPNQHRAKARKTP